MEHEAHYNDAPPADIELIKRCARIAEDRLLEHGSAGSFAVLSDENNEIFLPAPPFQSEADKDHFAMLIRLSSLAYKAERVAFCSEAWSIGSKTKSGEDQWPAYKAWREENPEGSFEDFPGEKSEVIHIVLESHAIRGRASHVIERAIDGTPFVREDLHPEFVRAGKGEGMEQMSGRFTNLLSPKELWDDPATQAMVTAALEAMGVQKVLITAEVLAQMKAEEEPSAVPEGRVVQ